MQWFKVEVNPEPWAVGPLGVGRRGGKIWAYVGRNEQLYSYQEAVKEELTVRSPALWVGDVELFFLFWRQVEREHHKNYADSTNLQKATEDAIQGVLIENDRNVRKVGSQIMEQGPNVSGRVLIGIDFYRKSVPIVPADLLEPSTTSSGPEPSENTHDQNVEEIF